MLTATGIGGHELTTLAFNAGVATLQQTLTNTDERTLNFGCARANRSFTDKHADWGPSWPLQPHWLLE